MIKKFLNDVMEWLMDYFIPIVFIGIFAMLVALVVAIVSGLGKPTLEKTVEACILEQREEEPECKFAILKYTRNQNKATVMPVPIIVPHR